MAYLMYISFIRFDYSIFNYNNTLCFVIIDVTGGKNVVIGEMDRPSAKELIFENAVYIHRGRQYMVELLDIENSKCFVRDSR